MELQEKEARVMYFSALVMKDIVSGDLPFDTKKSIYEFCTRKNLFTGESLTDEHIFLLPIDKSYFSDSDSNLIKKDVIVEVLEQIYTTMMEERQFDDPI